MQLAVAIAVKILSPMFKSTATASRHIAAFAKQLVIMLQEARLGKPGMVLPCTTALDMLVEYSTSRYGLGRRKKGSVVNAGNTQ